MYGTRVQQDRDSSSTRVQVQGLESPSLSKGTGKVLGKTVSHAHNMGMAYVMYYHKKYTLEPHYNTVFGVHIVISVITE